MTETPTAARSVIENTVAVLRCFSIEQPVWGVTEIAQRVGLHKSTVSRILVSLENETLVAREPDTRRYRLGLGTIAIAAPLLAQLDARRIALPMLHDLALETGESAALMIRDAHHAVCVEQIASPQEIKHTTVIGKRYTTAFSASVKLFLAYADAAQVATDLTAGTLTYADLSAGKIAPYLDNLQHTLATGVALNVGDTHESEVGIAAPVFDHRNEVHYCVLISAPRFRMDAATLETVVAAVTRTAHEISRRLGSSK